MRHDRVDDAALIHARRRARRRLLLAGGRGLLAALPPLSGPLWAEGAFAGAAPPATMTRRRIPSTGEGLPVVGCGTWRTFDVGDDAPAQDRHTAVLRALFAAG